MSIKKAAQNRDRLLKGAIKRRIAESQALARSIVAVFPCFHFAKKRQLKIIGKFLVSPPAHRPICPLRIFGESPFEIDIALLNALEITGKKIQDVRIVVSGAGAAAVSCTRLYKAFGATDKNIVMLDSKGVIRKDRDSLTKEKAEFATDKNIHTLKEAMDGADVFMGLSQPNIVSAEMIKSMANLMLGS